MIDVAGYANRDLHWYSAVCVSVVLVTEARGLHNYHRISQQINKHILSAGNSMNS